jgi:Ca2+-dependent lipid-binding protein
MEVLCQNSLCCHRTLAFVIRSSLLPDRTRGGSQKSPVVKRNCNPVWNHTFVFENVSWMELKERSLELTVWDYDRIVSNDFLGGVRLNLGTGKNVLVSLILRPITRGRT